MTLLRVPLMRTSNDKGGKGLVQIVAQRRMDHYLGGPLVGQKSEA